MFRGRFEGYSERPTVDCHLTIPFFGTDAVVPFLLDTGADCTVLLPADARRLKVDFAKLSHKERSFGFGGKSDDFVLPALLIVRDEKIAHAYRLRLRIAEPDKDNEGLPSVMGRDILNQWRVTFDYRNLLLEAEVRTSDEQFPHDR